MHPGFKGTTNIINFIWFRDKFKNHVLQTFYVHGNNLKWRKSKHMKTCYVTTSSNKRYDYPHYGHFWQFWPKNLLSNKINKICLDYDYWQLRQSSIYLLTAKLLSLGSRNIYFCCCQHFFCHSILAYVIIAIILIKHFMSFFICSCKFI